ncbi:hypothetical protein GCM10010518_62210 [Kitasatospora cinereorecta]
MSWVDVLLAVFDSPERARSVGMVVHGVGGDLLRKALGGASFSAPSLMCSYWRSRFALEPCGMTLSFQSGCDLPGRTRFRIAVGVSVDRCFSPGTWDALTASDAGTACV